MNMTYMKHLKIIKLLSEDKYTSGEYIGSILGISRAAVSKQIKKLKDSFGLKVISNTKTLEKSLLGRQRIMNTKPALKLGEKSKIAMDCLKATGSWDDFQSRANEISNMDKVDRVAAKMDQVRKDLKSRKN